MNIRGHILLYICLICDLAFAQPENLIKNGGFEEFSQCIPFPSSVSDQQFYLSFCEFWFNPTQTSPDFFNSCFYEAAPDGEYAFGSPRNFRGWQQPHSGETYAGAGLGWFYWMDGEFVTEEKEYLGVRLHRPLKANKRYCFSTYVSLAEAYHLDGNGEIITSNSAIYSIGALFKNYSPYFQTVHEIQESPNLTLSRNDNTPIDDTLGWSLLRGLYSANGGERVIIIGSFEASDIQPYIYLGSEQAFNFDSSAFSNGTAYYYFDDVSLVEIEDVSIDSLASELTLTRPFTLQALGWAEEYQWSTIENPYTVIATGNPATVILSDSTSGFILHARNCEVDQYDTVLVSSIAPPPLPPVIIPGLSIEQNVHKEFFKITYITEQVEPLNVFLFNSAGQLVATQVITSSLDFAISNFAPGIYYCRIFKGSVPALTEKIVVMK